MPEHTYVLFYEYVAHILERRPPHRDARLAEIRAGKDSGRIQ